MIEREGSFALPEGTDALTMSAVALAKHGLAFVGQAWSRGELDPADQNRRWIGVVSDTGPTRELELDAGSIHAIAMAKAALLEGIDGPSSDTRAWFGAIDERGRVTSSVALDREVASTWSMFSPVTTAASGRCCSSYVRVAHDRGGVAAPLGRGCRGAGWDLEAVHWPTWAMSPG